MATFASPYSRPAIVNSSVRMLDAIEARRHVDQPREAANEKTGANQQHDRKRQLRDDQHARGRWPRDHSAPLAGARLRLSTARADRSG